MAGNKFKTVQKRILEELVRGCKSIRDDKIGALIYLAEMDYMLAERIIEHSTTSNRKLRQTKIMDYAHAVSSGDWLLKSTLEFFEDGRIHDGNHRLRAIVKAKGKEWFWVQVLRSRDATKHGAATDDGTVRNVGDFLHFEEVYDSYRTSPFLLLERNFITTGNPYQKIKTSKADYLELYTDIGGEETMKGTFDIVPKGMHMNLGVPRAFIDWFAYHVRQVDAEGAQLFLQYVCVPEGLKRTDPMFVLHQKLKNLALKKRSKVAQVSVHDQCTSIIKAWNLHYDHEPCTTAKLRYRVKEEWPGIKGELRGG